MEFDKKHSLSLKQKIKLFVCATCCDAEEDDIAVQKSLQHSEKKPNTLSSWLKSELPVIKEVCSHVFSGKNRRSNSTEFRYDPLSYALNFEDDDSHLDEFPLRDFCSRLPPSPVKANKNAVASTNTVNWS
ncbi:uncharacterized protein LOC110733732 [Chenopodium quinoa]|uniref:uncharacterized protein LOC110733732 n=1 Tax=Chenopodium quinoa TaxID=63459 RepID=UPI000B78EE92|nr:uncharacterized protein LOC110733732 [Chenopodium quinoa]